VPLFSKRKELGVRSFILKLVNNNCEELKSLLEGPRLEERARLTVVVLILPVENKRPQLARMFAAVTKEFSSTGVAVVLNEPLGLDEVVLGFRYEGRMQFVRAKARHLSPMGAGFYQLGLRMTGMIHAGDYPELETVSF
jgi:hypothetical protein